MFFRAFITSGLMSGIYTALVSYLSNGQLPLASSEMYHTSNQYITNHEKEKERVLT